MEDNEICFVNIERQSGNHGHFLIPDSLFLNIPRMNVPKINLNRQRKGENQIQ